MQGVRDFGIVVGLIVFCDPSLSDLIVGFFLTVLGLESFIIILNYADVL